MDAIMTRMDAGIYVIYNTVNDKLYIGSAVSMHRRLGEHRRLLQNGVHPSSVLQRAWNKYGAGAFEWGCLEVVACKEELVEREQAWLDALKPWDRGKGYNRCPTAGSQLGHRWTEEARRRQSLVQTKRFAGGESRKQMSLARAGFTGYSAETIEKKRLAMTGKKHTDAAKAKMSVAQQNRSPETRAKLSLAHKRRYAEHPRSGRPHSEESRAKISLAITQWHVARRLG
jgi:group I intron endonuclease